MTATERRPLLDKYMSLDQGERVQVLYVWIDGRLANLCVEKRRQQPRPQGFSLKKWVGREKPWGRGCEDSRFRTIES